jgi:hypothetical protein
MCHWRAAVKKVAKVPSEKFTAFTDPAADGWVDRRHVRCTSFLVMLRYRKRSFADAHGMLQSLRANPEELATLKELQKLLLHEVIRAEEKIREQKTELRIINGEANSATARRSSYFRGPYRRVSAVRISRRCFGDAIAFLCMDKFARYPFPMPGRARRLYRDTMISPHPTYT